MKGLTLVKSDWLRIASTNFASGDADFAMSTSIEGETRITLTGSTAWLLRRASSSCPLSSDCVKRIATEEPGASSIERRRCGAARHLITLASML